MASPPSSPPLVSSSPQAPLPLTLPPPPTGLHPEDSTVPSSSGSPKRELLSLPGPESVLALTTSPAKKTPPLPWTHQETVNLIQAYQEKWYSLKKGQLKASQWEEVAATVADRCGFVEPSKTSTQCRHKIEKLRKRYRAERLKPYQNSWQYFELMDQMERGPGPLPLNARPVAVVKSPNTTNNNSSNGKNHTNNYSSVYSGAADYDYNNSNDSDEEWNASYGVESKKNKSKCINNLVHREVSVKRGVRNGSKMGMERSINEGSDRVLRALRNPMNGKRTRYNFEDSEDDDVDEDDEEDERMQVKEEQEERGNGEGGGRRELAEEIRGFAEKFMKMENKKIEMMRETQRCRMEMEKKRMDMVLEAQRKIIDTIGRMFGATKKLNISQEI